MSVQFKSHLIIWITFIAGLICGCRLQGEDSALGLTNEDHRGFNRLEDHNDLAIGTRSRLQFESTSWFDDTPTVLAATSTHPAVVRVVSITEDTVTVDAVQPGAAEIVVETDSARDRFKLYVHPVARVRFSGATNQTVLVNTEVSYTLERYDAHDRLLAGSAPLDIEVNDPKAVRIRLDDEDSEQFTVHYDEIGEIEFKIGENAVRMNVINVDAAHRLESPESSIKVDETGAWRNTVTLSAYTKDDQAIAGVGSHVLTDVSDDDACDVTAPVDVWGMTVVGVSGTGQTPCIVSFRLGSTTLMKSYWREGSL
ncbi:MAG: hypothetical protein VX589_05050 [Myxococcota bacterium]|nr:hypothetical protein [Myxococcota bacterium]